MKAERRRKREIGIESEEGIVTVEKGRVDLTCAVCWLRERGAFRWSRVE